jgi:hypothetical protein
VSYDNAVRYAVRTVKNPTGIGVDVVQYKDHVALRVKDTDMAKLSSVQKVRFLSYVAELSSIIETHGKVRVAHERVVDGRVVTL